MENLKKELAGLLEVEKVDDSDVLSTFDCWDSLTILSIIAMVSEQYNKHLTAEIVREAHTIGNLLCFNFELMEYTR